MLSHLYNQIKSQSSISEKLEVLRNDKSFRKFFVQFIFAIFMAFFLFYLITRAFSLELGFGHLTSRAGFGISHTFLVDYTSNNSRWDAYFTGVINTIRVSLVGIILATILGVLMGLAILSKNFLVNRIAAGYVEFIRNTPLLVQIIFWQLVLLQLPQISNALTFGGISVWSNRGILLPFINTIQNGSLWVYFISPNILSLITFLIIALAGYFILGIDLYTDVPVLEVNQYGTYIQSGGFALTPEFAAILFALVLYTGTFITEIVRGSIQSLPKGQTEAAQALGLSNYQRITLIILPQALRSIIPPLTNQYLNLTKNSSLSVAIAYPDVFMVSRTIMNNAGHALPMLSLILITFLCLSLVISLFMNLLNKRVTRIGA